MFAQFLSELALAVNDLWREEKGQGEVEQQELRKNNLHDQVFSPVLSFWCFLFSSLFNKLEEKDDYLEHQSVCQARLSHWYVRQQGRGVVKYGGQMLLREPQNLPMKTLDFMLNYNLLYLPMTSFVWDCLLCSLPSLLLLLLSLALRWPRVRCWTRLAVKAAGWRLWVIICLILRLPLHTNKRTWTRAAGSPESDILPQSSQSSDGPRLICKPTALAKYLLRHSGSLASPRLASWPGGDPHLQTLSSLLCGHPGDTLQFTRDHLLLRDGGVVALDWAVGARQAEAVGRKRWEGSKEHQSGGKALGCFTAAPPVLLLVPQSWGGMTPHLEALCHQALRQGFYVVVFHARGTAGCPLTTVRLTEFGDPADLEQVDRNVSLRFSPDGRCTLLWKHFVRGGVRNTEMTPVMNMKGSL